MKEFIEIPFGAKDSELCGWEYTIPEGFVASIENGKIIVKKEEGEDEKIRKEIIEYLRFKYEDANAIRHDYEKWIAWLEKQGQKPTWSKEDNGHVQIISDIIEDKKDDQLYHIGIKVLNNEIAWLHSLKDRVHPQWKPNEEQIQALEYQVNSTYIGSWQYKASKELLEQLKKL